MNSYFQGFLRVVTYKNNFVYFIKCLKDIIGINEVEVLVRDKVVVLKYVIEIEGSLIFCI